MTSLGVASLGEYAGAAEDALKELRDGRLEEMVSAEEEGRWRGKSAI